VSRDFIWVFHKAISPGNLIQRLREAFFAYSQPLKIILTWVLCSEIFVYSAIQPSKYLAKDHDYASKIKL
jgi:hypothetical protein